MNENETGLWALVVVTLATLIIYGDPDLLDAMIYALMH